MNRSVFLFILCVLLSAEEISAQAQFLAEGKIEFERKINVHRQFDVDENDGWFKEYISRLPKFHTTYFNLSFSGNRTVYKPGREGDNNMPRIFWGIGPAKENIILKNLSSQLIKSNKKVFEETYLIQDSIRQMEWRITDEMRTIAGFECRKAVGKICDSVYVVAFYTDEIMVSGGPESFSGLPGMILGLAIPRLYTTWFATKVELIAPKEPDFAMPSKGKKINSKELFQTLDRAIKDWGKEGQRNIWWVML